MSQATRQPHARSADNPDAAPRNTGKAAPFFSNTRSFFQPAARFQPVPATNIIQRYSTEDCSEAQRTGLNEAYDRAKEMMGRAISRLTADPVTPETRQIFANHFGGYAGWKRYVVVEMHLKPMRKILNDSDMTFECESECDGEPAYTYWVFGDVHLCPGYFPKVVNERAETTIHELYHLRGSFDLGYHGNNEDADTWWGAAINNADSFSELCQDLYEQP